MGGMGPEKIIVILLVVTLLFGAKRIPEIGSSLGKGIRAFKASLSDAGSQLTRSADQARHAAERSPSAEMRDEPSHGAAGQPKRLLE